MGKLTEFRNSQLKLLEDNQNLSTGDVTSMNVTILNGGVLHNVVPAVMECTVDCRIAINTNPVELENMIRTWCKDAGEGVEVFFPVQEKAVKPTELNSSNKYWKSMESALDAMKVQVKPTIFYAITDSRFLRSLGIPCFGISPLEKTPVLLHDHNEYVSVETYLKGIEFYKTIINNLADLD
ncbi:ACY1.2 family protein [Megaselia abdita]